MLVLGAALMAIFERDGTQRPVYGDTQVFQTDPHWRDYVLFYEYFHGDNGAGLGLTTRRAGQASWRS